MSDRQRRMLLPLLPLLLSGCASGGFPDLATLAARPPLPYSVLVTGGAFVLPAEGVPEGPSTFVLADGTGIGDEAISLERVHELLRAGNVFVAVDHDRRDGPDRRALIPTDGTSGLWRQHLDVAVERARADGHDLLVVVEGLQDGPIEFIGVNGQWPITIAVWLVLALGVVVPDHSYESRARLRISVRDLHSGRSLYNAVLGPGPIDLPLIERADFLGFLSSLLIPPFLVADAAEVARRNVAAFSARRMVESAARQLKSIDAVESIDNETAARIALRRTGDRFELTIDADADLSFVRFRLDGAAVPPPEAIGLERELLGSAARTGARMRYAVLLPESLRGRRLQVLAQTVPGRVASSTFELVPE